MIRCKRGMPSFCYIHHGHNQATQRESPRTRIRQVLHTKIFGECVLCTRKSIYTYREQEYAAAHCACANAAHSLCKPLARLRLVLSSGCKLIAARYLVLPQLQLASIGACCCCAFEYHCIEYQRYRWTPVESDLRVTHRPLEASPCCSIDKSNNSSESSDTSHPGSTPWC